MRGSNRELDEIFRQMERMRKAWENVSRSKKLNKSQFGTLFALARLSGGRGKHPACETEMQCEGAALCAPGMPCESMGKAESAAQCEIPSKGESAAPGKPAAPGEAAANAEPAAPSAKPVTLSELAFAMHQSLPALSQRVTVLEEKGFVERVADPADRRVTGLRLTEAGQREMDIAFRRFSGVLSQAVERVGKQNMNLLLQLLGELADALNEAAKEAGEEPPSP